MSTVPFGDKSRLIIKNIPNSLDNKSLDKLISKKCKDIGVTKCDIMLLTKEKKINKEIKRLSRGICYVGFISEKDATKFLNHYNNSYFNSCKVFIEYSKAPGTVDNHEHKAHKPKTHKTVEGGQVVIEKEVAPRKAGVSSKQVHITFDSDESDGNEDEGFIDHTLDRNKTNKSDKLANGDANDKDNLNEHESHETTSKDLDMNRVVIFNLPYFITEEMIRNLVKPYGKVEQIHIPLHKYNYSDPSSMESKATKGMCFVTFCFESDAIKFIEQKNKSIFSGRLITIMLANTQHHEDEFSHNRIDKYYNKRRNEETFSNFKMKKRLIESSNTDIWNILHIDIHSAINTISSELGIGSEDILKDEEAGVNVALTESYILNKIKQWLLDQGINYEVGDYNNQDLHDDLLIIKNLPYNSDDRELIKLFGSCGQIIRFTTSPYKLLGLVQFSNKFECEKAFKTLSYKMYKNLPIYLQKVPKHLLPNSDMIKSDKKLAQQSEDTQDPSSPDLNNGYTKDSPSYMDNDVSDKSDFEEEQDESAETDDRIGHVSIYVSNIDSSVDEQELDKHFSNLNGFVISKIIRPIASNNTNDSSTITVDKPRYGFIEFDNVNNAKEAIKKRCGTVIGGKLINLELSKNKQTISKFSKKKENEQKEENDVIIVKNLPFQATKKELSDLFKHYSNVKTVRIPKSAGNTHRGFGFVEFMSKNDAKTAMENLKNVHLYGRRLVLQYVENAK